MFSLGLNEQSGQYFIAIPVSNSMVDYQEFYEIDQTIVDQYPSNIELVKAVAEKCRKRLMDEFIIEKPGRDRGFPVYP